MCFFFCRFQNRKIQEVNAQLDSEEHAELVESVQDEVRDEKVCMCVLRRYACMYSYIHTYLHVYIYAMGLCVDCGGEAEGTICTCVMDVVPMVAHGMPSAEILKVKSNVS